MLEKKKMYDEALRLNLENIPYSEETAVLNEPLELKHTVLQNRVAIQPMEGCDATADGKPGELTYRRYERFAKSGAGIIWMEAVAVMKEARANPHQLFMNENNVESFKRLIEKIKTDAMQETGFEPIIIMQATHSGRYSKPNGFPEPIIVYNNPIFEKDSPIDKSRIITDDELKRLEERYAQAAAQAEKAGFDGMDIKSCHRYLASELLSAYERKGEFGGSFENRTRLLRNGIKNAIDATRTGFITTTRLNVYDGFPYPYGFGVNQGGKVEPDLSEAKRLIDILHNELGVELVNITIGNPYFNSYVNRPSNAKVDSEKENPLVGVNRMYHCVGEIQRAFPSLAVIGSGVSYFKNEAANLAAGAIKEGYMKIQGFGRMAFAYPDFFRDITKDGQMNEKKCCIACGKCSELMRAGTVAGCVIKDSEIYADYYRKFCMKK